MPLSSYLNPDATLKLDGSITEHAEHPPFLSGGDYDRQAADLAQLKAAILSAATPTPPARRSKRTSPRCGELSALQAPSPGPDGDGGTLAPIPPPCDGYESC